MLRPVDTATRDSKLLNGLWRFCVDTPDLSEPWKSVLPGDLQCPVPASYNDIFVPSLRDHFGKVWYQRQITIPRGYDQRVVLRIDAATHEGEVYLNDKFITSHVGGYMPFEADFTGLVQPGDEVRVTIGVNNILTNETIPPGEIITNEVGVKTNKYYHDFFNYAGLPRSVRLCSIPNKYVKDVTVKTDIDGSTGLVKYDVEGEGQVEVALLDKEGKEVASERGEKGTLKVSNAKLWQPGAAYLYKLRIRLFDHSKLQDEYSLNVGIRTIKIKGLEILINDKPFYFRGYGRHEDTPVKGKAHDDSWMVHDFELMKWTGANSFRTSHYPYAEEVMDYADAHGWVVIDETPAVGLNLNIQGGLWGGKRRETFGKDFANDKTREAHAHALRELIQRDKNRPSVVMWCITNEPDSMDDGARAYFEPLTKIAREMDDRPITFTNLLLVPPEKEKIADLFDVISLNRYYGWYVDTGDLATAERHLEKELKDWQTKFNRPLLMLEYGADTVMGLRSLGDTPWSEEFQAKLYEMYHRVFDRIEAMQGEQVWNFADFSTGVGIFRVEGNKKGIFSRDRKPKMAAYTLKARWAGKEGHAKFR